MKRHLVSRTTHVVFGVLSLVLVAVGASCIDEKKAANTSSDPLSLCVVFADDDGFDPNIQSQFEATYADYAHLLDGTLGPADILRYRGQRLDSLDQVQQHYIETSLQELPDLVKDTFAPDWSTWPEWQVFSEKYRQGDELWHFTCPPAPGGRYNPARGYIIVRDGRLAAMLLNRAVTFHASYSDYESLLRGVATEDQVMTWKRVPLNSLEEVRQHYRSHFGSDSSRILLEERCSLDEAGIGNTKWDHWHVFGRKYEAGDQLWYFESPSETWNGPQGCCGYLIARNGRLHAILVVAIS
ncbi:MAG TPA: hypothetical protein PLU87_11040 [Sedimentisphaerales bacterium]|nr:hypothetical protein [Sedimentisphaerales bacterium]HRS11599.1 hypothetical protein [Sedimentisphaerales bacterium]HRV48262.1 hypothetical protein [Sedimentisphaerales bacterium]